MKILTKILFMITLLTSNVTWAQVTSGSKLTASLFNDLETRVTTIESKSTTTKILSGSINTTGNVTALSFTGLTVGKEYLVTGNVHLNSYNWKTIALQFYSAVNQGGELYNETSFNNSQASWLAVTNGVSFIFTAASDTMHAYVYAQESDKSHIAGNGTRKYTYIQIRELP